MLILSLGEKKVVRGPTVWAICKVSPRKNLVFFGKLGGNVFSNELRGRCCDSPGFYCNEIFVERFITKSAVEAFDEGFFSSCSA
jgi:hypothetical protein